jgi:hypothetical protein
MRRLHLGVGAVSLLAFLASGAYMRFSARPFLLPDGPHLMYLSRHIYILCVALLHLVLGAYFTPATSRAALVTQRLGSALMVVSAGLLIAAFVREPMMGRARTELSTFGLYSMFGGALLHVGAKCVGWKAVT